MDILQQAENDVPVPDLCREHSMSSASLYKWHAKFGGMNTFMIKCMKELAEENRRVKSMVAEERLKSELRKDALEGELQSHLFAVRWLIKRWRMPKAAFAWSSPSPANPAIAPRPGAVLKTPR